MQDILFKDQDLTTVSEALDIAEDVTGDFYKFSALQWKRHRYDVKTLKSLKAGEISKTAFALLCKGKRLVPELERPVKGRDYYFICLQDRQILRALERDRNLGLLALLIYVFTHELVHIVRFCSYDQRFEVSQGVKEREESLVHAKTYDILKNVSIPRLGYVLEAYQGHRVCELGFALS